MPITDWPVEDRPREKLLTKGASALTDAELLAIFLQTGAQGKTALDIAKELLREFGSLQKLCGAGASALTQKSGIGAAKFARIHAGLELGKRFMAENIVLGAVLNNSVITQKFFADKLRFYANEVFACAFMDTKFRLLRYEELFHGTINETTIYPRELVRRGLLHNAAKIILAHNHPSGNCLPSAADKEATQLIKQGLSLVDIDLVDHIIIGNPENFSFADARLL